MNESFEALPDEKQKRIMRAAMIEFGEKGYEKASTNHIVGAAGIGKGMLFYYFGTKRELFDFCYDYGVAYIRDRYYKAFRSFPADFVGRLKAAAAAKYAAIAEEPAVYAFFGMLAVSGGEEALNAEQRKEIKELRDAGREAMFSGIDITALRKDITPERALKYAQWLVESAEREVTAVFRSGAPGFEDEVFEKMWAEFDVLLRDIKLLLYDK